jgi:2-dehydro-3-deoxyphosphogluconate aldolase / (4S)-4-hydroxy-2-oxoglutarate aldolase
MLGNSEVTSIMRAETTAAVNDNAFSWELFYQLPVVGILRGFNSAEVAGAVQAAMSGGLRNFEVTMDTAGAEELILLLREIGGGAANVGAGTVCSMERLEKALAAGAGFIVTPTVLPEVVMECSRGEVPVFPGAMSPDEIHRAFDFGADIVKVFPSEALGPDYIRALKGPFPGWRLMPTGGITVETISPYKRAGADAYGVGSPLFSREEVRAGNWEWVREQARRFSEACQGDERTAAGGGPAGTR